MSFQRRDGQGTLEELMIEQGRRQLDEAHEALQFLLFWHAVKMARRQEQLRLAAFRAQIGILTAVQYG